MQRLYLQFYLTILVVLAVFVGAAALLWRLADDDARTPQYFEVAAELTGALLPEANAPQAEAQRALDALQRKLRFDLALYQPDGTMIAMAGRPPPRFEPRRARTGWRRGPGGPTFTLQLPDRRWLVARQVRERPSPILWVVGGLGLLAIAIAVGAYPVVRRLGARLERLKAGVEQLGSGDLGARVKVEGRDEVAALAASFNRSAQRIEELIAAHRLLLANCSHELRTPLARISMATSLLGDGTNAKTREALKRDIDELDRLIEEILLASRLDAIRAPSRSEEIDLLALAAEEAARDGVAVEGASVAVRGERTLLRRMVRNLIDNARRHGSDTAPDVRVTHGGGYGRLTVRDHGPGVPEGERERIFEPFYRLAGLAESGRGSGLGLALVLDIARRHGGDAVCLAAESGGSRFRIDLPAA